MILPSLSQRKQPFFLPQIPKRVAPPPLIAPLRFSSSRLTPEMRSYRYKGPPLMTFILPPGVPSELCRRLRQGREPDPVRAFSPDILNRFFRVPLWYTRLSLTRLIRYPSIFVRIPVSFTSEKKLFPSQRSWLCLTLGVCEL